nr:unnamed protein product [Callosobruchus analis]
MTRCAILRNCCVCFTKLVVWRKHTNWLASFCLPRWATARNTSALNGPSAKPPHPSPCRCMLLEPFCRNSIYTTRWQINRRINSLRSSRSTICWENF